MQDRQQSTVYRQSIIQIENIEFMDEEDGEDIPKNNQQQRYSCQRFIQTLKQLHSQSILFYCPYDQQTLSNFYKQISEQQKTQKLDEVIVKQFISQLKQTNRQFLSKQIQFYQSQIKKLLLQNIKMISRKQFVKMTDHLYLQNQLLTQIMLQNSKNADYISCDKILILTEEVRNQIQSNINLGLTISSLQNKKIEKSQIYTSIAETSSFIQSKFLQTLQPLTLKKLITRYIQFWHRKLNFFRQFVADQQIRQDMQDLIEKISGQQSMIIDETTNLITINEDIRNKCLQFQKIYQNMKEQENMFQNVIEQQQNQIVQLKQTIVKGEKQNQRYVDQNNSLAAALEQTKNSLVQLAFEHQQMEKQFQNYKNSYSQLYTEYEKLTEKHSQQIVLKRQQQNKRIFTDRTLKQQLEDAMAKLDRALMLRDKQKKQFREKEQNHINIIASLQIKLQQLQRELKQKNQNLKDYIKQSSIMIPNPKSIIKGSDVKSEFYQSSIFSLAPKSDRFKNQKSITELSKNIKFSKVNISVGVTAQDLDQKQSIFDHHFVSEEQNLTDIIKEDNNLNKKEHPKQFDKKNKVVIADCINIQNVNHNIANGKISKFNEQKKICAFKSKGIMINHYGLKFETTILLTAKRFCYFDTKGRMTKYLPVGNIKSIIFCYHNPNLFVIKIKNGKDLDANKHILNDMMFVIRKRNEFAEFLSQSYIQKIRQNKIEVSFKKEENIFLSIDDKTLNLKVKIPGLNNPLRLCLSGQPVFFGKILEADGFFNFYKQCCFIIQPAAIFCFEGTQITQLEGKKEFLFVLPLVENMSVKQKINSNEAFGRKLKISYTEDELWQKTYSLIFLCKEDMRNFIKVLKMQNQQNKDLKQSLFKKTSKIFDFKPYQKSNN